MVLPKRFSRNDGTREGSYTNFGYLDIDPVTGTHHSSRSKDLYYGGSPGVGRSRHHQFDSDGDSAKEHSDEVGSDRTVSEYVTSNERMSSKGRGFERSGGGFGKQMNSERHQQGRFLSPYDSGRDHQRVFNARYQTDLDGRRTGGGGGGYVTPPNYSSDDKPGSEIYVSHIPYRPASQHSHYSHKTFQSDAPPSETSVKTKTTRKGGVVIETMATPNPFCPNTRGICCLMILVNLGLLLITLGFVVVLQLFDPPFIWYFGVVMLIFGFAALIASLIYCVVLVQETKERKRQQNGELYWTHHWQKRLEVPELSQTKHKSLDDKLSESGRSGRSLRSARSGKSSRSGRSRSASASNYNNRFRGQYD